MTVAVARRHPDWLKVRAPGGPGFAETSATVRELGLHTVCQ
jgi:lipoic acid synthetase